MTLLELEVLVSGQVSDKITNSITQTPYVITDDAMGLRYLMEPESYDSQSNELTVNRKLYDSHIERKFQWKIKGKADFGKASGKIEKVRIVDADFSISDFDATGWDQHRHVAIEEALVTNRHEISSDKNARTVSEQSIGEPENGVVSTLKRDWDFVKNKVTVTLSEGLQGQEPYLEESLTVHGLPQNQHTQKLRALIAS